MEYGKSYNLISFAHASICITVLLCIEILSILWKKAYSFVHKMQPIYFEYESTYSAFTNTFNPIENKIIL